MVETVIMPKLPLRLSAYVFLVACLPALRAQTLSSSSSVAAANPSASAGAIMAANQQGASVTSMAFFSRIAFGGGIASTGVNMQTAVNLASHFNLRGTGSFFNYEDKNISTNGFTVDGKLNLGGGGVLLDYFPFAHHGLRISAGALVYNRNALSATVAVQGGTSFTLNDVTYYSSPSQPVTGAGSLGLHAQNPAPMVTFGWGNMIPRRGGHWSFPIEIGAAYTGEPTVNLALTSGQVCADPEGTLDCQNVVGDASVNQNLQAQIAKYKTDLNPLRFYPIFSFGMAYSFRLR